MSSVTKDYFYADNYYDYAVQFRFANDYNVTIPAARFHWSSLTRVVLVILLRIGFVLVQIGSVPVNNVNLILLQNVVDLCTVTATYFLLGFVLSYNGDMAGLIGEGYWIGDPTIDKNEAMTGWQAVTIASAIYTSAVVGRMHTVGYLLVGILLSGLIQPLLIHWAWTTEGWMAENELDGKRVGFRDYAGAGVIHVVGGFSGFVGCIVLGRRILRLRDLDDASINAGSAGTVFAGLLLILAGLQGPCMSTYDRDKLRLFVGDSSHVYVNNLLAAASCSLLVVALHFACSREAFNHWTVMRCVQGTIAGVIMISAATNDYSPQVAVGMGCLGGIVFYLISGRVFRSALEDYCNVVAVHLCCAILGSILAPLCATQANEDTVSMPLSFSWQLICLTALLALVGTAMLLIFIMLECFGVLRNRSERLNHVRANAAVDRGPPRSFLQRLFLPDNDCVYLQPGSISNPGRHRPSVGSRFWKYQTELDMLEEGRTPTTVNKPDTDVHTEDKTPGARVRKARQVHTLAGCTPVSIEAQGAAGESIDDDDVSEERRERLLGRELKYILDPIQEIDEETSKEFEAVESSARHNIEGYNAGDKGSLFKENFNASVESGDSNESNYQLRRTIKLMDLHRGFIKEDWKILAESKRVDSTFSDSYDEGIVFGRTSELDESTRNITTSNNSSN